MSSCPLILQIRKTKTPLSLLRFPPPSPPLCKFGTYQPAMAAVKIMKPTSENSKSRLPCWNILWYTEAFWMFPSSICIEAAHDEAHQELAIPNQQRIHYIKHSNDSTGYVRNWLPEAWQLLVIQDLESASQGSFLEKPLLRTMKKRIYLLT